MQPLQSNVAVVSIVPALGCALWTGQACATTINKHPTMAMRSKKPMRCRSAAGPQMRQTGWANRLTTSVKAAGAAAPQWACEPSASIRPLPAWTATVANRARLGKGNDNARTSAKPASHCTSMMTAL